jgi:small-conductance mechanosensitive channel
VNLRFILSRRLAAGACALALAVATIAGAQSPATPGEPMTPGKRPAPAARAFDVPSGTVVVFNRPIVEFRASFMGVTPRDRAADASVRIRRLLGAGGDGTVSVQDVAQGGAVMLDGQLVFVVTTEDAQATPGESARSLADQAAEALKRVVAETREARDRRFLTEASLRAAVATAIWLALMWLARAAWRFTARRLGDFAREHAERLRVGGSAVIARESAIKAVRRIADVVGVFTMVLLTWEWLGYVLGLFPYTRPWSEGLTGFLVGTSIGILESIAQGLPSLFVAILIFVIAWAVDRALRNFFDRIATGRVVLRGFDRDAAPPTKRLATVAVWLFAAAMAYPYIPGSETDAFKGLSVLLGLMVTVGASSIVGQAASGLILMYTRTYRPGEYVRIGDRAGTITRMGMFTTTVRTGLGEELTMPNSQVLGTVTTNYSRTLDSPGFVVSVGVSIGYDEPWRQVHALLAEAARRTEGIASSPAPQVFQTALDDFYVKYQLVCRATAGDPAERAATLSTLYAAIQDAFNEAGVQIMSPHYLGDPAEPKIVPRAKWHAKTAPPD